MAAKVGHGNAYRTKRIRSPSNSRGVARRVWSQTCRCAHDLDGNARLALMSGSRKVEVISFASDVRCPAVWKDSSDG